VGYLYRPKLKTGERSRVWWAKYYINGRPVRESTGVAADTKRAPEAARRFLQEREGRVATGQPILPRADRIWYEEVADARLKNLKAFFQHRRVPGIGPAEIQLYIERRQKKGAANGTINRELATLSRMFRLAYKNGKLLRLPIIERLKESAPRQGFFERDQFLGVRRRLPEDLQVAVTIAYVFGWRMYSEVLTLERRQLDLEAGTLRLDPGTTKNDEGRVVYLTDELTRLLAAQLERIETLQRRLGRIVPFLFPHLDGDELGRPRRDIRSAWRTACKLAGCPGMLPHDFRRTAVRNMVNAGVPERVAMMVTGHRSRAVFDRYHIVSPADLQDVARRLTGTFQGTSGGFASTPPRPSVRS
jgi:integrase